MTNFIKGRDNLACTIFVPVVCGNNCSFCTSKKDYEGFVYKPEYLHKIIGWIDAINHNDMVSEFVISGGEPFMDLDILNEIVSACDKPVFINTSLPRVKNIYDVIKFINETDKIKGINISRHIGVKHDVAVYGTDIIEMINKPIRINCLITTENFSIKKIEQMLTKYVTKDGIMLNLRADYRTITDENLKTRDNIFNSLLEEYEYLGSASCLVCNSSHFVTNDKKRICYHRGIEHSAVLTKNSIYVNDIIINMFGDIFYDWGNPTDNINDEFIKFVLFNGDISEDTPDDPELVLLNITDSRTNPIQPPTIKRNSTVPKYDVQMHGTCGVVVRKKRSSIRTKTELGCRVGGDCGGSGICTKAKRVTTGCGTVFGGGSCGSSSICTKAQPDNRVGGDCGGSHFNYSCGSPGPITYMGCFARSCGGSGC